ncbi:YihY/virulence factor BrkB family protein [Altericroceibacterium xinjiangense]|uniref:YihY/virulence factor BrkB family protein n=1 Tax=Altericroceibacterium xinjiangense TaxID=762261 RepID=UPI000F7E95F2|nr:YihY/virulence factor BrkB family protein [Altericroceibacterium xinjiangense]
MTAPPPHDEEPPSATPLAPDLTPENRRRNARKRLGHGLEVVREEIGPGTRFFNVAKRAAIGAYTDGFTHAGNLAYMAMLAIFPFFILGAAIFSLIGEESQRAASVNAVLMAMPRDVRDVIGPVANSVVEQRSGWVLWAGGAFALWTVSSLVESIREMLRRAYGTPATMSFWRYRLRSAGIILLGVFLLLVSLISQVLIGTAEQMIDAYFPQLNDMVGQLALYRIVPAIGLFGSLYLIFYSLTPAAYRLRRYPKWPGALLVTVWWVGVTIALPPLLRSVFSYDLTYGSLAGAMIALFFFYLVGLGMVVGAELNAALAETPEEEALKGGTGEPDRDDTGQERENAPT